MKNEQISIWQPPLPVMSSGLTNELYYFMQQMLAAQQSLLSGMNRSQTNQ